LITFLWSLGWVLQKGTWHCVSHRVMAVRILSQSGTFLEQ
jgi:hypothetical protein